MEIEIIFLGTRGSVSVDDEKYKIFGGATLSVVVKTKEDYIVFDAGSGFLNISNYIEFNENNRCNINLFLSHTHFDHIMGLVASDIMFNKNATIDIYGINRDNKTIEKQINSFMAPPIWPVDTSSFKANISFNEIKGELEKKNYSIDIFEGTHPGGVAVYKLHIGDKKIVYATDIELDINNSADFINFSKDADLLICDGQYGRREKMLKSGYGHSSWRDTVSVAKRCGCKALAIIHHDPYSDDEYLLNIDQQVKRYNSKYFLAKRGDRIIL